MAVSLELLNHSPDFGPWRQPQPLGEKEADNNAIALLHPNTSRPIIGPASRRTQMAIQSGQQAATSDYKPILLSPSKMACLSTPASPPSINQSSTAPSTPKTASTFVSGPSPSQLPSPTQTCSPSTTRSRLPASPRPTPKRRRPLHDVDGPNTATLASKKRRIRRDLITSRLSQPFSLPASHILNREAAAGDKRFMKLAAVVAARRLTAVVVQTPADTGVGSGARQVGTAMISTHGTHHPLPAEMMRRAAMLNRFRLRVRDEARERGDRSIVEVAATAALLRSGSGLHGVGFVANARMPTGMGIQPGAYETRNTFRRPGPAAGSVPHSTASVLRAAMPTMITHPSNPHPLSRAAAVARSSPPSSPNQALKPRESGSPGLLRLPPSPPLKALKSPELRAARCQINRPMDDDELDDELLSFPINDDDMMESDDVYADFSVIFGGGGDSAMDDEADAYAVSLAGDGEQLDDCMDDLDGIPFGAR